MGQIGKLREKICATTMVPDPRKCICDVKDDEGTLFLLKLTRVNDYVTQPRP